MNASSFKIYADLDGYLSDPIMGQVNEMIYDTIREINAPYKATNRPYPVWHPAHVIFREAYSLMNDFINEPHPEEYFAETYFNKVRKHLLDTYAAEIVLSVDFTLLRLRDDKKSRLLISSIENTVDVNSAYFKAFERLADELSGPVVDWKAKYFALQRQYDALYASIPPPMVDRKNQLFIPFDSLEAARQGYVSIEDLLRVADKNETLNIYFVLRLLLDDINHDFLDMVMAAEAMANERESSRYTSNITITKNFTKIDCIRVIISLFKKGKFKTRDGSKLTLKALFENFGDFLGIDLSNGPTEYTNALADNDKLAKNIAIFEEMSKAVTEDFNSK